MFKNLFKKPVLKKKLVLCCPNCRQRFSDWFLWDGLRYCYPCFGLGKPVRRMGFNHMVESRLITEEDGVLLDMKKEW